MFNVGPADSSDPPSPCAADGPIPPTGTVLEAVECDTARYVALAPVATDVNRTYLVLTRVDADGNPLSYADVAGVPEVQNAVAHLAPVTESVRVLTHPGRRRQLSGLLDELDERRTGRFEFGGERFSLGVRVG